ncbi:MAG: hypothetical protein ABIO70_22235 [Pseudomonadota bacterium]
MKNRAVLLSVLALLSLGLAWWLLRPSPPLPEPDPVVAAPSATVRAPSRTAPASGGHLPFIEPAEERPVNVPGAPPPEPIDYSDDPVMQAAMRGELPVGQLGLSPLDLITERDDALRGCWREHQGRGSEGQVLQIRLTIEGEEEANGDLLGRISTVRVLDAEGNATQAPGPFEVCAHTVLDDLEFVAPEEGATVEITVPLALQAGE